MCDELIKKDEMKKNRLKILKNLISWIQTQNYNTERKYINKMNE